MPQPASRVAHPFPPPRRFELLAAQSLESRLVAELAPDSRLGFRTADTFSHEARHPCLDVE
jgi:hypothetical protein